jgi:hypothetical protein
MPQVIKTEITIVQEGKDSFKKENKPFSFVRRRERCRRKEKQEYKTGQNPVLRRRKKEKRSVRRKSLPDLKDNGPDSSQTCFGFRFASIPAPICFLRVRAC